MQIGWNNTIFEGFAGKISTQAALAFNKTADVAWIEPGKS
jgi:hypothetical protein